MKRQEAGMTGEAWDSGRLAEALGIKRTSVAAMVCSGSLPRPDGRHGRKVYWRDETARDIIESRKAASATRRRAGKIEGFYTSAEITAMVPGMSLQYLYSIVSQGLFPRAAKSVGRVNYWAADAVDPLLQDLRMRLAGSHRPDTGLTTKVDPDLTYSCAAVVRMVPFMSRKVLLGMVAKGDFPQPVRIRCANGAQRTMWLGRDIAGRIGELREKYACLAWESWFSRDICRLFGLDDVMQLHNVVNNGKIPPHDGYLFTRKYWLKSSVTAWLEKYAGKRIGVYVPEGVLVVPDPARVHVSAARQAADGVLERAIERARQNAAYYESVAAELEREQGRRNGKKA